MPCRFPCLGPAFLGALALFLVPAPDQTSIMIEGICIRSIEPADADALAAFYERLDPDTRYRRFHGFGCLSAAAAANFSQADGYRRAGFVAVEEGQIVGHACLEPVDEGRAELGIAVADELAGHGLGTAMVEALESWARNHGIHRICTNVLATNGPMLRLMRHLGPITIANLGYPQEIEAEAELLALV